MRRPHDEIREVRVPSEALARWALETQVAGQEATCAALAFLMHTEHAATTLLPVPKVLRSDMGGLTLLSLFTASEIGGSAPVQVLKPTGAEALAGYGDALTVTPAAVQGAVNKLING